MIMDFSTFIDVAEELKINDPRIVEKDYYAIQLLKLVNELDQTLFQLVFAGGTCLAKAYNNTYRMSEDIDIKLLSRQQKITRSGRRKFSQIVIEKINESEYFNLSTEPIFRNQHKNQKLIIDYSKVFEEDSTVLRQDLLLEMVESNIYQPTCTHSVSSMCAEVLGNPPEVKEMHCVGLESVVSEKLIALLWRTSAIARDVNIRKDTGLIRHVYDIHCIVSHENNKIDFGLVSDISNKVLESDALCWANKYPEFKENPKGILEHGLKELCNDDKHRDNYLIFSDALVYNHTIPVWDEALKSICKLYESVI